MPADSKRMYRRAILPLLLIACFATLPALGGERGFELTHSERIKVDDSRSLHAAAVATSMPQAWCGTKSTSDQTVNATDNASPKFKFIYAHAADQPDRFDEAANAIQRSVAVMHDYLLASSAGKRTIAIDLGTSCGPSYVDIQELELPGNRADYMDGSGNLDDEQMSDLLINIADGQSSNPRHYVFLVDQFDQPDYMHGIGLQALDDSPGSSNRNNDSDAIAYVSTPQGALTQFVIANLPRMMLHEMTHTMGGVQNSAPNSTDAGHCIDGSDVMCYDDGGPRGSQFNNSVCTPVPLYEVTRAFDCNNDDYFNIAPKSGSYLATHWNVYNSVYLVRCVENDPLCTRAPSSDPSPDNPAARSAANSLYIYKRGKRSKRVGTVTASGAFVPGSSFVRNSVTTSRLKLPKGKWKVTVCFRESGSPSVCQSSSRKTSSRGYLSAKQIYANTDRSSASAWGSVRVKPLSRKLKKRRLEVRSSKKVTSYSLNF